MAGFKQGNKGTGAGVTSMTVAFLGACAAGNFIGATMQSPNTVGGTVADNVNTGNYSVGNNHSTANNANDVGLWYKENILSGTPTVTFTPGGAGNVGAAIGEYTGVLTSSSIDKNGATEVSANTTITSGSLTNTGANGDLILLAFSCQTQNITVSNSTSGWNLDENNTPNATMSAVLGSDVQAVAGAFTTTTTVTGSAQDLCVIVVSFKLAAVASGTPIYGFGPGLFSSPSPSSPAGIFLPFNPTLVISTGPVSNIVTATDNLSAISDTATRILSLIRTASDALAAISDTAVTITSLPRTVVDNLSAMSDTATRILSLPRTLSESLGALSDTATRAAQSFLRTASDTLSGLSETATRVLSLPRTATDNLPSMSDTANAIKVIIRTATDNLSAMSDTATRAAMGFVRTTTDTLGAISETVTRILSLPRTVVDNLGAISDTANAIKVILRSASDTLNAMSDTATRTLSLVRSPSDTLASLSDTTTRLLSLPRTLTENLGTISESAIRVLSQSRSTTDNLASPSDSTIRILGFARSAQDTLSGLADSATRAAQTLIRSATDSLSSISDTAVNTGALPQLVASLVNFVTDGTLINTVRDATLKVFNRDASKKGSTRG